MALVKVKGINAESPSEPAPDPKGWLKYLTEDCTGTGGVIHDNLVDWGNDSSVDCSSSLSAIANLPDFTGFNNNVVFGNSSNYIDFNNNTGFTSFNNFNNFTAYVGGKYFELKDKPILMSNFNISTEGLDSFSLSNLTQGPAIRITGSLTENSPITNLHTDSCPSSGCDYTYLKNLDVVNFNAKNKKNYYNIQNSNFENILFSNLETNPVNSSFPMYVNSGNIFARNVDFKDYYMDYVNFDDSVINNLSFNNVRSQMYLNFPSLKDPSKPLNFYDLSFEITNSDVNYFESEYVKSLSNFNATNSNVKYVNFNELGSIQDMKIENSEVRYFSVVSLGDADSVSMTTINNEADGHLSFYFSLEEFNNLNSLVFKDTTGVDPLGSFVLDVFNDFNNITFDNFSLITYSLSEFQTGKNFVVKNMTFPNNSSSFHTAAVNFEEFDVVDNIEIKDNTASPKLSLEGFNKIKKIVYSNNKSTYSFDNSLSIYDYENKMITFSLGSVKDMEVDLLEINLPSDFLGGSVDVDTLTNIVNFNYSNLSANKLGFMLSDNSMPNLNIFSDKTNLEIKRSGTGVYPWAKLPSSSVFCTNYGAGTEVINNDDSQVLKTDVCNI